MHPDLRRSFSALLALSFLATLSLDPNAAQAQDRTRFLRWTYEDATALAQKVNAKTVFYALSGTVLLTPVSLLDQKFSHEVKEQYNGLFGEYLDVANELGGPRVTLVAAALFGVSLTTNDARFQDAAFTSLESLLYAGLISYGAKYTIGRFRPEQGNGPHHFAPFSGSTSFPSGHTNAAFAVLTPWALYYPNPVTRGLLIAGAGGTALARISRDKHWATDVVAGGAIGFLTAYWLTRQHQRQSADPDPGGVEARLAVTPAAGPAPFMVTLLVDF